MATWDLSDTKHHILICNGSSCNQYGAEELTQAIREEIANCSADDTIHTTRTLCNGRCQDKCVVIDYPSGTWYKDLTPKDVPSFISSILKDKNYNKKASHNFNGKGFERTDGVSKGVTKDKEKVQKASKIF